jgi:hypothetical protein
MVISNKANLTELKKYLKERSQAELIAEITDLFTRFEAVKEYYQLKLSGGENEWQLVEKYKQKIYKQFFPTRGVGEPKLAVARKAVSDYRKISPSPEGLADLMLFYVETGVKFTNTYGDIAEPFYNSLASMYERALEHLAKYKLLELFEERCKALVNNTPGIGWGLHDTLSELYHLYFKG